MNNILQRVINLIYILKYKCGTFPFANYPLKSKDKSWSIKYIFHNYKYLKCLFQYEMVMYHVFIYNVFLKLDAKKVLGWQQRFKYFFHCGLHYLIFDKIWDNQCSDSHKEGKGPTWRLKGHYFHGVTY